MAGHIQIPSGIPSARGPLSVDGGDQQVTAAYQNLDTKLDPADRHGHPLTQRSHPLQMGEVSMLSGKHQSGDLQDLVKEDAMVQITSKAGDLLIAGNRLQHSAVPEDEGEEPIQKLNIEGKCIQLTFLYKSLFAHQHLRLSRIFTNMVANLSLARVYILGKFCALLLANIYFLFCNIK